VLNPSPDALELLFVRVTSTSGIDDQDMQVHFPPGKKQYACIGYTRIRRTNTELSTASRVTCWQKDQKSSKMARPCPLETKSN